MPIISKLISLGGGGGYTAIIDVSSVSSGIDVYSRAIALGWNGTDPLRAIINVNSTLYSNNTGVAALVIQGLPVHSKAYINVGSSGIIMGMGGYGGGIWYAPTPGGTGGTAIYTRNTTFIANSGIIGGGGGGGGCGSSNYDGGGLAYVGGSSGGGGRPYASNGGYVEYAGWTKGNAGTTATISTYGTGGTAAAGGIYDYTDPENPVLTDTVYSGAGGNGGGLGTAGSNGSTGDHLVSQAATAGGAAGYSIDGTSYCTISVTGTILGSQVN
jgi:hypothetical protein